ncbi:FRG domain-containing protein [Variovorax sp. J22G21]|uniref:FRG domain-containing protein n=1 Tax=Variovorax fucosicus TaxID=3053517 RepID=UPI002577D487|nr:MULTISPECIES: FRG domain-containing protein [unclassified Variovorax]MDM0042539.1 FRG domain-containing protein [Variovorax sp. J22R193]MDM0061144.1 FRG domain-containing protein [Variovorax sp. J22G21]
MASSNWARDYYTRFHALDIPHLGPYLDLERLTPAQGEGMSALFRDFAEPMRQFAQATVGSLSSGSPGKVVPVDSPWHAWMLLQILQRAAHNVDGRTNGTPEYFVELVFRGQANAVYDVEPSFHRKTTDQELERRKLELFTLAFGAPWIWSTIGIALPPLGAKATAQHYQQALTDLVDITGDPAVAVRFASMSDKPQTRSAVFVYDLNGFLREGAALVMPPPLVNRLYLQRGAFLSVEPSQLALLKDWRLKIEFRHDAGFQVVRGGVEVDILPEDDWFKAVRDACAKFLGSAAVHEAMEPAALNKFQEKMLEAAGAPKAVRSGEAHSGVHLLRWVEGFQEMLYWYAVRVSEATATEAAREGFLPNISRNIAEHNPELVRLAAELYRKEGKGSYAAYWEQMLSEVQDNKKPLAL